MWITVKAGLCVNGYALTFTVCFSFLLSLLCLPNEGLTFSLDTWSTQNSPLWEKYVYSKSFFQETRTLFPRTNETPSEMKNSFTYSKERFKDDDWKRFSN